MSHSTQVILAISIDATLRHGVGLGAGYRLGRLSLISANRIDRSDWSSCRFLLQAALGAIRANGTRPLYLLQVRRDVFVADRGELNE